MSFRFAVEEIAQKGGPALRLGQIHTAHGSAPTPLFMPVGTAGSVKGVMPRDLVELGAGIVLGNTYHLMLRPGHELIQQLGGLHHFMGWTGPILTDSGGFQVFSLAKLRKITEEGVSFQSHIDGSTHVLTPEHSIAIQEALGADIIMAFDDCPPLPSTDETLRKSMELTIRWEERSLAAKKTDSALFAIVQGGLNPRLRQECFERLQDLQSPEKYFQGFALGGLSVGEPIPEMYELVSQIAPILPRDKPRYVMGVGTPEDLITCVGLGVDLFDCVMPTRNARNGRLFTRRGEINIRNARWRDINLPVDSECECYTCRNFSLAYLRHLYQAGEMLGPILGTLHNLHYYLSLLAASRLAISQGNYFAFAKELLSRRQELNEPEDPNGIHQ